MHAIELSLVAIFASIVVLSAAARAIDVPYPIVLVLGGALLAAIPGLPELKLPPSLVLLIFLPPLLYSAAFFANLRELRSDLRVITLLSVGLVLFTAAAVAVVAHLVAPGMGWAPAFALGAIVAPTDALAATTILRRLGVPRRAVAILEGESLLNDGTALVAFRVATGAATSGTFSVLHAGGAFAVNAAGGIAIGIAVAWLIVQVRARLDDPVLENTISLLSGYAAYIPAERAGVSGVLAAVTCGIYVGWRAPLIASPSTRLQGFGMWELLVFLLNAVLFVIVGLQLRQVLDAVSARPAGQVAWTALAVCAAVVLTRFVWQQLTVWIIRALDRRPSQRARRAGWRQRTVVAWAGMRGAVSLAAALSLEPGFPQRDLIVLVTFAVIFVTLIGQGLTLPPLIRRIGLPADGAEEHEELKGRLTATRAALDRLEELGGEEWTRDDTIERIKGAYRYRQTRLKARAGKAEDDGYEDRSVAYQTIVREVLEAQRREIVRLRNEGTISNDVMHRLERELDLEDERLEI